MTHIDRYDILHTGTFKTIVACFLMHVMAHYIILLIIEINVIITLLCMLFFMEHYRGSCRYVNSDNVTWWNSSYRAHLYIICSNVFFFRNVSIIMSWLLVHICSFASVFIKISNSLSAVDSLSGLCMLMNVAMHAC